MIRWILQVFAIGFAVYLGYSNRYRLLNVVLANGMIRKFLVRRYFKCSLRSRSDDGYSL